MYIYGSDFDFKLRDANKEPPTTEKLDVIKMFGGDKMNQLDQLSKALRGEGPPTESQVRLAIDNVALVSNAWLEMPGKNHIEPAFISVLSELTKLLEARQQHPTA